MFLSFATLDIAGFSVFTCEYLSFRIEYAFAHMICQRGSTVEQLICNQWVAGSIPVAGSTKSDRPDLLSGLFFTNLYPRRKRYLT